MKRLSVLNIGTKGLNTDISPWDLPAEFITFGRNFRVYTNYMETAGGYQNWSTIPVSINPGFLMPVPTSSGNFWIVAGRSAVYAFDGSTWTDISSAGGYPGLIANSEFLWHGCMLGRIPIINNFQHYPEFWNPPAPGQPLQPLMFDAVNTWQAQGLKARILRSHKTYLFALNLQEGATEYPDSYRWSNPADTNGLPFTWDETDPSGIAGRASLGSNYGSIIDGLTLRDSFCIYSDKGINILNESGDEFIWRRRELSSTVGLISANCIAEVKGTHFFLGDGDILRNDGTNIDSIIHGRIKKQFNARLNAEEFEKSFVLNNTIDKEIWFCIPEDNEMYPSIAYVYNWKDDSWAVQSLPENLAYANYGALGQAQQTWDNWQGTWDEQKFPWGSQKRTPLDDQIISIDTNGGFKIVDPNGPRDSGNLSTVIERTDMPIEGIDNTTTITEVFPHISGTSPVSIEFGSQKIAGGPVTWKPPKVFTPGVDRKINIRSTGQLHAWRISSVIDGNWTFSGMDIMYESAGRR